MGVWGISQINDNFSSIAKSTSYISFSLRRLIAWKFLEVLRTAELIINIQLKIMHVRAYN